MKKGMTPESVEQMGNQITDAGERTRDIYSQAQARVTDFDWTGEDRDRFISEFEGELGQQVQQVVQQTVDFAERASRNALGQRDASA